MEKTSSVFAALDAGKLPSQQQVNALIEWFLNSGLTQVEPSSDGALSEQGKVLVGDVRELLNAYKQLGENKNGDDIIQEALWHLSQADISSTSVNHDVDTDQASKDASSLAHALKVLLKIIWANFSSETQSVFHDFASFMRLALADAADFISKSAGTAAESLREVDSQIEQGDRNELGIKKSDPNDETQQDPRARFENAMDTAKVAGSKAIGAGQVAAAATEDLANRTSDRLQEAFYAICDRAQDNEDYHDAANTIFNILHKWIHKSLDTAGDVNTDTSLESFIDDPTPDQHLIKSIRSIRSFIERLAGGKSLDDFFATLRVCGVDIQQDDALRKLFDELLDYLRRSVDERGYVNSEEAAKTREDLKKRWKKLSNGDAPEHKKWRDDFAKLSDEAAQFRDAFSAGEDTKRIQRAQAKLGSDIEQSFFTATSEGAQVALGAAPWVWQDMFQVYLPRLTSMLKDIPIPRTEYKDDDVEIVLENIDISTFNLLPGHAYIRNITDIDIKAPAVGETSTAVGTLSRIYVSAAQITLREVSYYYKDKHASLGPSEFSGTLEFTIPPEGIDIDLVVRTIPNSEAGLKERQQRKSFWEIQRVDVKLSDGFDLQSKQSNHSVLTTVFKQIMLSRFKESFQTVLAENIRGSLEWLNAFFWDVGNRAEVFEDAGLTRGPSLVAGFWSELGHLQKGDTGFFKGWKATGTGLIKDEGNARPNAQFALGTEPQILPGEKRGPAGNFSEPIADKVDVDVDAEGAAEDAKNKAKGVVQQAQSKVKEGVEKIKSFSQTVSDKAEEERRHPGWKSDAFDV